MESIMMIVSVHPAEPPTTAEVTPEAERILFGGRTAVVLVVAGQKGWLTYKGTRVQRHLMRLGDPKVYVK